MMMMMMVTKKKKVEFLVAFLFLVGTASCELIMSGRPLLGAVTNKQQEEESTIKVALQHEKEVPASADEVWQVEGSPELAKHLPDLLPGTFDKVEIIGDGGQGTIVNMTFPPGNFPHQYAEKFVLIDHKHLFKKVEMIQGGFLDLGVTYYMDTIRVVATGPDSCVISSTTEYHVKPEFAKIVEPLITTLPVQLMDEAITKIVLHNKYKSA